MKQQYIKCERSKTLDHLSLFEEEEEEEEEKRRRRRSNKKKERFNEALKIILFSMHIIIMNNTK